MSLSRRDLLAAGAATVGLSLAAQSAAAQAPVAKTVQVLGHRGSSALWPEHTLASYAQAIADGADYVEPDLVSTKDGVLVARHDNNMIETTDVSARPEFAGRKVSKTIDGVTETGWFVSDFTLAELKTLRAKERLPQLRSKHGDGMFQVPTLDEMIDFVAAESAVRGRPIGLVPEIKHSTFFNSLGKPMEDMLIAVLQAHAYTRTCPIGIQSFEISNLKVLRAKLGRPANIKLMQLVDQGDRRPGDVMAAGGTTTYAQMLTPAGLADMAKYADVLSPPTRAVIPLNADGRLAPPTTVVANAHKAGLQVIPWTFRPENVFLAADFRNGAGDAARNPAGSVAEIQRYIQTGIDGFFTDDPALGRQALDTLKRG
jgi:glycerophosphoryl diester phosphodiesterase